MGKGHESPDGLDLRTIGLYFRATILRHDNGVAPLGSALASSEGIRRSLWPGTSANQSVCEKDEKPGIHCPAGEEEAEAGRTGRNQPLALLGRVWRSCAAGWSETESEKAKYISESSFSTKAFVRTVKRQLSAPAWGAGRSKPTHDTRTTRTAQERQYHALQAGSRSPNE
jgi:hypothetical protein